MTASTAQSVENRLILGACLGNCVHVAGLLNFLRLAEAKGYSTKFLGPAVSTEKIIEEAKRSGARIIALSYRLTPQAGYELARALKVAVKVHGLSNRVWLFGGTTPVVNEVRKVRLFHHLFDGRSTDEDALALLASGCTAAPLTRRRLHRDESWFATTLVERISQRRPRPIIRHHFGLPSLEETIQGIGRIAESECLDVVSIAPDQNAQQFFFHPEKMDTAVEGAGGAPIRTESDLKQMFEASRRGNYPLIRCYSGTQDLVPWSEMLSKTIHNAWCATPINWYSVLDGRSTRTLEDAIRKNMDNIAWNAKRGIPVEVNEPHHWSLRQAHDTIAVAAAYWSAFIAKMLGVRDYVAQLMMNTPLGTSPAMDLAKMWAKIELINSLQDDSFRVYRQVRAGLLSFPTELDAAKGQLAASAYTAMMLQPDIFHVVGFSEADHAATPEEVITSCRITRQVIKECMQGLPAYQLDPKIIQQKNWLLFEARLLLDVLSELPEDRSIHPLLNPDTYMTALRLGILDAPGLKGNPNASGVLQTRMIDGACCAVDDDGQLLPEYDRLTSIVPDVMEVVKNHFAGSRKREEIRIRVHQRSS
jgi:hypothetical protein